MTVGEDQDASADSAYQHWESGFAEVVLNNVRELRRVQRLTARELSERITAAGWPLSVNSLNGILGSKGRKSISVPQLIALGEALGESPIMLMIPSGPHDKLVEYRPGVLVDVDDVYGRFTGEGDGGTPVSRLRLLLERASDIAAGLNDAGSDDAAAADPAE